jgi:hypothetical protein
MGWTRRLALLLCLLALVNLAQAVVGKRNASDPRNLSGRASSSVGRAACIVYSTVLSAEQQDLGIECESINIPSDFVNS